MCACDCVCVTFVFRCIFWDGDWLALYFSTPWKKNTAHVRVSFLSPAPPHPISSSLLSVLDYVQWYHFIGNYFLALVLLLLQFVNDVSIKIHANKTRGILVDFSFFLHCYPHSVSHRPASRRKWDRIRGIKWSGSLSANVPRTLLVVIVNVRTDRMNSKIINFEFRFTRKPSSVLIIVPRLITWP